MRSTSLKCLMRFSVKTLFGIIAVLSILLIVGLHLSRRYRLLVQLTATLEKDGVACSWLPETSLFEYEYYGIPQVNTIEPVAARDFWSVLSHPTKLHIELAETSDVPSIVEVGCADLIASVSLCNWHSNRSGQIFPMAVEYIQIESKSQDNLQQMLCSIRGCEPRWMSIIANKVGRAQFQLISEFSQLEVLAIQIHDGTDNAESLVMLSDLVQLKELHLFGFSRRDFEVVNSFIEKLVRLRVLHIDAQGSEPDIHKIFANGRPELEIKIDQRNARGELELIK